jgi:hypothetical protein
VEEKREGNSNGDRDEASEVPPVWIRKPGRRNKQGRRRDGILQGPIRKYRKLRGPVCKTKFSVDLKPR